MTALTKHCLSCKLAASAFETTLVSGHEGKTNRAAVCPGGDQGFGSAAAFGVEKDRKQN